MVTMDQKKFIEQFLNYLIVGGVAFVFDFLTLYVLTEYVHVQYLISAACAFIVGLNVNYILAKYLVFKTSKIKNTYAATKKHIFDFFEIIIEMVLFSDENFLREFKKKSKEMNFCIPKI